jgi:hypothetical protein
MNGFAEKIELSRKLSCLEASEPTSQAAQKIEQTIRQLQVLRKDSATAPQRASMISKLEFVLLEGSVNIERKASQVIRSLAYLTARSLIENSMARAE